MDLIAEYCDEVVVIQNGQIALHGQTKEVLVNPRLNEYGAVMPEVTRFGHEMKAAGKPLAEIPVTIEDAERLVRERKA